MDKQEDNGVTFYVGIDGTQMARVVKQMSLTSKLPFHFVWANNENGYEWRHNVGEIGLAFFIQECVKEVEAAWQAHLAKEVVE